MPSEFFEGLVCKVGPSERSSFGWNNGRTNWWSSSGISFLKLSNGDAYPISMFKSGSNTPVGPKEFIEWNV